MLLVFLLITTASADVIIEKVDDTSGIILNKSLGVELQDAYSWPKGVEKDNYMQGFDSADEIWDFF